MELLAVLLAPPLMSTAGEDPPCKASGWSLPWASGRVASAEGSCGPKPESSREPESPADNRALPSSWLPSGLLRLTLLTKLVIPENEPAHAWGPSNAWISRLQSQALRGLGALSVCWVLLTARHEAHLDSSPSRCRLQGQVPPLRQSLPQSWMHEGLMAHSRLDGYGLCSRT